MIKESLFALALALGTATLSAQTPKPTTSSAKPATPAPKTATQQSEKTQRYVPAVTQQKVTVTGCLKHDSDWKLTDASLAGKQEKTTYKLEGIGDARLSLFVGKRIQAAGALQDEDKPAAGKSLPRFEATAVQEATGTCS
jgi:hypothetical protein